MARMTTSHFVAVGLVLFASSACERAPTSPPPSVSAVAAPAATTASTARLVECPSDTTLSTSAVVGAAGGVIELGGTTVRVPAGAVSVPTSLSVTIPASRYMEVDVSAAGFDHFTFLLPIEITISYGRCQRSDLLHKTLSVWHIDSETDALLEHMGGQDDKAARAITFTTGHLSGYAIAE